MKWVALVARLLAGFGFFASAVTFFLLQAGVISFKPPAPPTAEAKAFGELLGATGYMTAVKVLEIAGGLLLLVGRYVPLGVVLLAPVAVNIALYEVFLVHGVGPGVVLTGLLVVVIAGYWPAFRGLVAAKVT